MKFHLVLLVWGSETNRTNSLSNTRETRISSDRLGTWFFGNRFKPRNIWMLVFSRISCYWAVSFPQHLCFGSPFLRPCECHSRIVRKWISLAASATGTEVVVISLRLIHFTQEARFQFQKPWFCLVGAQQNGFYLVWLSWVQQTWFYLV